MSKHAINEYTDERKISFIRTNLSLHEINYLMKCLINQSKSEISINYKLNHEIKYINNLIEKFKKNLADIAEIREDGMFESVIIKDVLIWKISYELKIRAVNYAKNIEHIKKLQYKTKVTDTINVLNEIVERVSRIVKTQQLIDCYNCDSQQLVIEDIKLDDESCSQVEDICAVCRDAHEEYYELKPCFHIICVECYLNWHEAQSYKGHCMLCRRQVIGKTLSKSVSFWNRYIAMQSNNKNRKIHSDKQDAIIRSQQNALNQYQLEWKHDTKPNFIDLTED